MPEDEEQSGGRLNGVGVVFVVVLFLFIAQREIVCMTSFFLLFFLRTLNELLMKGQLAICELCLVKNCSSSGVEWPQGTR